MSLQAYKISKIFSHIGTFFTFSCSKHVYEAACFLARRSQSLVCAGGRSVWDPQCYGQQDQVLPRGSSSSSRGSVADPGPYPRPSCWRSVWSSQRVSLTLYTLNDYQRFEALVSLPLSGDQKPSHLMNRMLALLPDDYKPDFILRGLFFRCLPINVQSHLLHKKVSYTRALALKADELNHSRVSPSSVNHLSDDLGDSLQVNLVSSRSRPSKTPLSGKIPLSKPYLTRAPLSSSPTPPGAFWFHKKHGEKALNCRKPCSMSEN